MDYDTLNRALKRVAMDSNWTESLHHRADNGRFTSGSGRGKAKGEGDGGRNGNAAETDGTHGKRRREEMDEETARGIVKDAFGEVKCEIKGLKLVGHSLHATVTEADEGTRKAVNDRMKAKGLVARIKDKTTFTIAEDGYDDAQVMDEPMLVVLVDLCRIEMLAKDLHYRAQGKAFYGIHQLADLAGEVAEEADALNEVYYMGEKAVDPPDRAFVAAKAAELVGKAGNEDELIRELVQVCGETGRAVETAKRGGVTSGTAAVLDEISKRSLLAKGLLARTMKSGENSRKIDAVISKGVYIKPEATGQDSGTHER